MNTVGGYAGGTPLWELRPEVFEQQLNLNLRATYALARAVTPSMIARKSGVIVNIASKAAWDHAAGAAAYAATKAAAVALIDSLAADLIGTGVRANSVLPSIIDTEANRRAMPNSDFAKWPKPQDIAKSCSFSPAIPHASSTARQFPCLETDEPRLRQQLKLARICHQNEGPGVFLPA